MCNTYKIQIQINGVKRESYGHGSKTGNGNKQGIEMGFCILCICLYFFFLSFIPSLARLSLCMTRYTPPLANQELLYLALSTNERRSYSNNTYQLSQINFW